MTRSVLPIIEDGRSRVAIEVAGESGVLLFAAEELSCYLQAMSGVQVAIGTAGEDLQSVQLRVESGRGNTRPTDEYRMLVDKQGITIAGSTPFALLFGVYRLLENLGCRWFAPDFWFYGEHGGSEVPRSPDLSVPFGEAVERAAFRNRKKYIDGGLSHTAETLVQLVDWMPKVGLNILDFPINCFGGGRTVWDDHRSHLLPELEKRNIQLAVGGHGFENFLTADVLASHPDWAGMRPNGERELDPIKRVYCSSNDAATNYLADAADKYVAARPEIDIFGLWPPDTREWCECATCLALGKIEQRHAMVINRLAEVLGASRPSLVVSMAAYFEPTKPPDGITLASNVEADFCPIVRSHEHCLHDESSPVNRQYYALLTEWLNKSDFDGDINVYTYYVKYAWRSLPVLLPTLIADELRHCHEIGVAGTGTYSETADWWTFELQHYLSARLSFDPLVSLDAELGDYFTHRYGAAAQLIEQLVLRIESFVPKVVRIPGSTLSQQPFEESIYEFHEPRRRLMSRYSDEVSACTQLLDEAEGIQNLSAAIAERLNRWRFVLDYVAIEVEARGFAMSLAERALHGNLRKYTDTMRRMEELVWAHRDDGMLLYEQWAEYGKELPSGEIDDAAATGAAILDGLGVTAIVNAGGYQTPFGASQVPQETIAASAAILRKSVQISEMQEIASVAIADLTGSEAGMVTACAASGIVIAVAATISGHDQDAVRELPGASGLKRTIVLAKGHDINFGGQVSQMIRLSGAIVRHAGGEEVCTREDLESCVDDSIAAAVYVISDHVPPSRAPGLEEFAEVMHMRGIPVIADCAAEFDFRKFVAAGADLVLYSSHKVLNGLTAGIIAGRTDLVAACRIQESGIGRSMKVGKEGIVGTIAAIRRWQALDPLVLVEEWSRRSAEILDALKDVRGLSTSIEEDMNQNPVARVKLRIDPDSCGITAGLLKQRLLEEESIVVRDSEFDENVVIVDPRSLSGVDGAEVCDAIAKILKETAAAMTNRP